MLFDGKLELVDKIYRFIHAGALKGDAVLVYSLRGQSRACCVLCAYFMRKYKWTLHKALDFLNTRRPNLEIRASFYEQMLALEENILRNPQYKFRFPDPGEEIRKEEALVSNTFENSRAFSTNQKLTVGLSEPGQRGKPSQRIKWIDEAKRTSKISTEIIDEPLKKVVLGNGTMPKPSALKGAGGSLQKNQGALRKGEPEEKTILGTSSTLSTSENRRNSNRNVVNGGE